MFELLRRFSLWLGHGLLVLGIWPYVCLTFLKDDYLNKRFISSSWSCFFPHVHYNLYPNILIISSKLVRDRNMWPSNFHFFDSFQRYREVSTSFKEETARFVSKVKSLRIVASLGLSFLQKEPPEVFYEKRYS